jgi:two-component sensor histidine kinase
MTTDASPFHVLLVDDDPAVLRITSMLLERMVVDGHPLLVESYGSAAAARERLTASTFAVAIIDVVMESEHAGLDLVRDMSADPRHALTQIVIRTGQPGAYPESRVVQDFRISDYWPKNELTPQRIRAGVSGLVRSHQTALALDARLAERTVLLRELHHRVKNNLQNVSSLLLLQSDRCSTEASRSVLIDASRRVRSMALVHRQIYTYDDFTHIDFFEYARVLASGMQTALAPDHTLVVTGSPTPLSAEQALPCGLILNELLTNAFKHGRPPERVSPSGPAFRIVVEPLASDGGARVAVIDAGPGFEARGSEPSPDTLGFMLIRALLRQVGGFLRVDSTANGTQVAFDCPERTHTPSSSFRPTTGPLSVA